MFTSAIPFKRAKRRETEHTPKVSGKTHLFTLATAPQQVQRKPQRRLDVFFFFVFFKLQQKDIESNERVVVQLPAVFQVSLEKRTELLLSVVLKLC